jgi:hypothetical protein
VLLLLTVVDADVAPAGTVTDAAVHAMVGTELERATTAPPGRALGAGTIIDQASAILGNNLSGVNRNSSTHPRTTAV